ncbi:hypothetical protein CIW83_18130 [Tissierella sp. P1]|uniref:hypothetical protein n=1 Tax=Tissierella sp. P1 TaxID=1280483 RepID=UPI000BA05083|nr:hypothetical protein [Tissierella sp. P1]OZV10844.1 hypothetical protein CIW83_18130 [Tissierella sp. P1]
MNNRVEIYVQELNTSKSVDNILCELDSKTNSSSIIVFELDKLNYLHSTGVLNLIGLSKLVLNKTGHPLQLNSLSFSLFEYLSRLNIQSLNSIYINTKEFANNYIDIYYYENINLARLFHLNCQKHQVELIKYIRNFFDAAFDITKKKNISRVCTMILELTGNCIEHSDPINEFGETFFLMENTIVKDNIRKTSRVDKIRISVGDFGCGIKNHMRLNYPIIPDDDLIYIQTALIDGKTGRLDQSGGLGFGSIKNTMKLFKGSFTIHSGTVTVTITDDIISSKTNKFLPGTQFEILIYNT